jgi:uncharacterized membrane protein YkvA (DUF1232 family)
MAAKGMMLAALAYFVLPIDAVPDFIAGLGYTDDAAVFAAMLAIVGRNLKPRHREAAAGAIERLRPGATTRRRRCRGPAAARAR